MSDQLSPFDEADKLQRAAPSEAELGVLEPMERLGYRLVHAMNHGRAKRFLTFCQRHVGSLWIFLATYNLMNVFGIENIENSDIERPVVLIANHRSFFDMYTVSSVILRRTRRPATLFFPVRAKFFYDSPAGWLVNLVMGWFSMYPPFFREQGEATKREFDKYSMRRLVELCSTGYGHMIGFHPEGKRNTKGGPYDLLPAQPGIGKVIYEAHPQVIPVFIAGLGNDLAKQILGNWFGGQKIRIWFGAPIDLNEYFGKSNRLRTHKDIADFVMSKVAELGERDKLRFEDEIDSPDKNVIMSDNK